ncbi:MAG: thiamine pyrophosphate-binding protein [Chloroflexota bacterium]
MTDQTNAQIIAKELYAAGVRYVFGQPGGEVVELIEAMAQEGVEFVLMGHESAAALAAATLGLATGIPGVCLTTLGPGACNLTLGLGDAWLDRHPMLAISARTPDDVPWYNHQRLPLNEMFAPITKASIELTDEGCGEQLREAIELSLTPPYGPVYLTIPGPVAALPPAQREMVVNDPPSPPEIAQPLPDESTFEVISTRLNQAKRPIVVIGIALDQQKDGAALRDFLAVSGLPYADTPKTKGLVDPNSPAYLGTYLSASGDRVINRTIQESDCILGIGYDPVETTYDWQLGDTYYSIANYSTAFGSFTPAEVVGDVTALLNTLQEQYDGTPEWHLDEFAQIRTEVAAAISPGVEHSDRGLAPLTVAQTLHKHLPVEAQLTVDTGQHKMIFAQAWQTNTPLSYFGSNGLSSMGVALPGAIALALHDRTRPIVCVLGDGCFNSMVQELETIQRLDITPLIVVMCDQALSLIRLPQKLRGYPGRGIDFAPVDWAKVAEGYGVQGVWVRNVESLGSAVSDWAEAPKATVIAVQVDEALYRGNSY